MRKLQYLLEEIKASFWFIPMLILLVAIAGSLGLIYLDHTHPFVPSGFFKYLFPGSPDSARSILSTIAGAMIGVAGTVFSITLVILTLASSQFGSRLLRNFMYDKINQVVLGTYVSTFVYCLIVLNAVKENDHANFVPIVAVFASILAAVLNIILLIIFIHHVAKSIQSDKVISDITVSMSGSIQKIFPEMIGEEEKEKTFDVEDLKKRYAFKTDINGTKSGYLESIDNHTLMNLAKKEKLIILLNNRPGDFIVEDLNVCELLSSKIIKEELKKKIIKVFIIGQVRTPLQDAEFAIHQIVEIATRALSPGINDTYTAISCIDNLSATMCYLTKAKFPTQYRYDDEGNLRIIADRLTFSGMFDTAYNQIRQFSEEIPAVVIRLMEAFITIDKLCRTEEQKKVVAKHAKMVFNVAKRTFHETHDLTDLEKRYELLKNGSDKY